MELVQDNPHKLLDVLQAPDPALSSNEAVWNWPNPSGRCQPLFHTLPNGWINVIEFLSKSLTVSLPT